LTKREAVSSALATVDEIRALLQAAQFAASRLELGTSDERTGRLLGFFVEVPTFLVIHGIELMVLHRPHVVLLGCDTHSLAR
jgi:hypothetical protein